MSHGTREPVGSLTAPLVGAMLPLLSGLTRRKLLAGGAMQREARLKGWRVNYYEQGPQTGSSKGQPAQPPILLIHGLGDSALTWVRLMPRLARTHQVYALDLPGYGMSGLPQGHTFATLAEMHSLVGEFLRTVIDVPALVVGSSLGGWLAVRLAWAAPDRIRGIVLLNPGGAWLAGRASWEPFAERIGVRDLEATRQVYRAIYGPIAPPPPYLGGQAFQATFQRQVVQEFVATMQEGEFLRPNDLSGLLIPAALVWGLADTFLPSGSLEFFRDNLPAAPTLLLKHCGHLPQQERPRAVAHFIRQYTDGH